MEKANTKSIKLATLVLLAASHGAIFRVAYLNSTFYPALREALNVTNEQLGSLTSMYGIVAIIFYGLGGLIADKFKAKYCISIGLIGSGLATFWYSTMPSYETLRYIFMLLSFFNILAFWSAYIKAVRNCGDETVQGKVFGINEGVWAASSAIFSFIVVAIISGSASELEGLVTTLRFYMVLYFVFGALAFFLIGKDEKKGEKREKMTMGQIMQAFKLPGLYLCALIIFCAYSVYGAISYLTGYLSDIFGLDPQSALLNGVSVVRTYAIGILAGPIAGVLADKIGSPSKWIRICMVGAIVGIVIFYFIPETANYMLPMVLMLVVSCIVSFMRGTYLATMAEARIPLAVAGTAAGIVSMIGYLPDAFMYTMMGSWLDNNPGLAGYQMIFMYMAALSVVAIFACTALLILKKKGAPVDTEKAN